MKTCLKLILFICFDLVACVTAADKFEEGRKTEKQKIKADQDNYVEMHRSRHHGYSYTVRIYSSGSVLYEGDSQAPKPAKNRVSTQAFEEIIQKLGKVNFWEIKEKNIKDECANEIADPGSITLKAKKGILVNTVRHLDCNPEQLDKIENLIDEATQTYHKDYLETVKEREKLCKSKDAKAIERRWCRISAIIHRSACFKMLRHGKAFKQSVVFLQVVLEESTGMAKDIAMTLQTDAEFEARKAYKICLEKFLRNQKLPLYEPSPDIIVFGGDPNSIDDAFWVK